MEEGVLFHPSTHIVVPLANFNSRLVKKIRETNGNCIIGREFTLKAWGSIDFV